MREQFTNITYPDPLLFEYIGGEEYKLLADFRCCWLFGEIVVPAGFITDRASVPQFARSLIPKDRLNKASVIHDWCFVYQWRSFKQTNQLFLAGMKATGIAWWRRRAAYAAVSSFIGRRLWHSHDEENAK
jgi:hypothetical protein